MRITEPKLLDWSHKIFQIKIFKSESPNLHARSWQEKGRPAKRVAAADFQRGRLHWGEWEKSYIAMHWGESKKVSLVREKSYIGVREKKVILQYIREKEKLHWCEWEKLYWSESEKSLHYGERKSYIGVLKFSRKYFCSDFFAFRQMTSLLQDFEDFDLANEDDVLEEFLGIERENPKVKATICLQTKPKNPKKNQLKNLKILFARWSRIKLEQLLPMWQKELWGSCPRKEFPLWKKKKSG